MGRVENGIFKITKEERQQARERLKLREKRGSDKEYIRHLVGVMDEMSYLRKRANKVMLDY